MTAALVAWLVLGVSAPDSVYGTVRIEGSADPVSGAVVELVDTPVWTGTDSLGRYCLVDLPPGVRTLRFSCPGCEARLVQVFLGADSTLHLDVSLAPHPFALPPITVTGQRRIDGGLDEADRSTPLGEWHFVDAAPGAVPLFSIPDALGILSASPDVAARPEAASALNIRGGSADQTLLLLDGVPIINPYHLGGALSALGLNVIANATVSAGVPAARYGDFVSGVVALETRTPQRGGIRARGGVASNLLHQTLEGSVPGGGTFLASGRRGLGGLVSGGGADGSGNTQNAGFGDLLVKATWPAGGGVLEMFTFGSADRTRFAALIDTTPPGGHAPDNQFNWSTATHAVVWTRRGSSADVTIRGWRTAFGADAAWLAIPAPLTLASRFTDVGVGGEVAWPASGNGTRVGFTVRRRATTYVVRDSAGLVLTLAAAPVLAATFVESRWRLGPAWTLSAGVRGANVTGQRPVLEPRLAVRFAPISRLALFAGYARAHQYSQSLRNEESVLDALWGIALPAAVGAPGVGAARSDGLSAGVQTVLAPTSEMTVEGYVRSFEGLLLVAPSTAQPFAVAPPERGAGRAWGVTTSLEHRGDRVSARASYAFQVVSRTTGDRRYQPSFAPRQTLKAVLEYRAGPALTFRSALWVSQGRSASLLADDFVWAPGDPLQELAGSPQRIVGALDGASLPAYVRVDLGVRREWRPVVFGRRAQLAATLNLVNALNRTNAFGLVGAASAGGPRPLLQVERSVSCALEWWY
jgi:TonB-dependent receptor-like protein/carboxypeptidase family protein